MKWENKNEQKKKYKVEIIKDTVESYGNIVGLVNEISSKIDSFTSLIHEIDKDKNDIILKVENGTATSEEISASTEQVVAASKEVYDSSAKVSTNAEDLAVVAEGLSKEVDKFII